MVLLQRKLYFSKDQEGVQHFAGGVQLFRRGIQMLIPKSTCDFIWGGWSGPLSPSGSAHVMLT